MRNTRPIEYQMPKKMFRSMLEKRTKEEGKLNPYDYVMNIINEEFGLRGTVTRLSVI